MHSTLSPIASTARRDALLRLSSLLRPQRELSPDAWGAANRTYPPSAGRPGPRDPTFTPYGVPFGRAVASRRWRRVVAVFCAQSGKSETLLDVIGARMAQRPAPVLYVGPTQQFIREQWAARVEALLDEAPTLADRVQRGKRSTMTRKVINGVPLRLAHAGSSTALKSDPAALAIVDEADELMANVKGQGNPIGLVDARGDTVADFVMAVVSTPSNGSTETEVDPVSGLDFWRPVDPKLITSTVWKLWQAGTMAHWAVPCPACGRYFIPRFKCVEWPDAVSDVVDGAPVTRKPTPAEVRRLAFLRCPAKECRAEIRDDPEGANLKAEMNRRGVYVCPGQVVDRDGVVTGEIPESDTASFWASGLMSPFRTIGDRAAAYVEAARSGDPQSLQTVVNAGLGELFYPRGGDAPAWQDVAKLRLPYRYGHVPDAAYLLTMGVDVQKNRLVYVVRAWGRKQESWLFDYGEMFGLNRPDETVFMDVWQDLYEYVTRLHDGEPIRLCYVDSGYRPGKPFDVPVHRVYAFCRHAKDWCIPTKGRPTQAAPIMSRAMEVRPDGSVARAYGLTVDTIDTDWAKTWLHDRVRWPEDVPGGWHIAEETTEDYCRQIVSEAKARKFTGGNVWIPSSKNNHALDAECLAYAAAYKIGVQRIRDDGPPPDLAKRNARRKASGVPVAAGSAVAAAAAGVGVAAPQEAKPERISMADLNKPRR